MSSESHDRFILPKYLRFARSLALLSGGALGLAAGATVFTAAGCVGCAGVCVEPGDLPRYDAGIERVPQPDVRSLIDAGIDRAPGDRAPDAADGGDGASSDAGPGDALAADGGLGGGPLVAPPPPANGLA